MNYRFTEDRDKDDIIEVLNLSFDSTYAYYAKKSFATLKDSFVAEEDGRVVGVINWRTYQVNDDKIGYIFWLAVHPNHRRKGIGKNLILEAIKCIHEEIGPSDIYSAVDKHNVPMRKLFGEMDFTPDGKAVIKKRYGVKCLQLYSHMMLMPWEDLFIRRMQRQTL